MIDRNTKLSTKKGDLGKKEKIRDRQRVSYAKMRNKKQNKKVCMDNQNVILKKIQEKGLEGADFLEIKALKIPGYEDPRTLGDALRKMSSEGRVIEINKRLFDVNIFEKREGYLVSTINHLAWIAASSEEMNAYGVGVQIPKEIESVANKSKAMPGQKVEYVQIETAGKSTLYITKVSANPQISYLGRMDEGGLMVLNNSLGIKVPLSAEEYQSLEKQYSLGDVLEFKVRGDEKKEILRKVGSWSEKGIESKICCILYGMQGWEAPEYEKKERLEKILRKMDRSAETLPDIEFFTIDSASTKDIDDAIAIQKTAEGFELFVAIANPSKLIEKDSNVFDYIKKSSNTFYFRNQRISMIHPSISEEYASLVLGKKKSALIYRANYDKNGVLKTESFQEGVLRVKHKICYEDVDKLLEEETGTDPLKGSSTMEQSRAIALREASPEKIQKVVRDLRVLQQWSQLVKKKSVPAYYGVPIEFEMNAKGKVERLYKNEMQEMVSQQIVEQAMLAANIGAARFLGSRYPILGIFRNQYEWEEGTKPKPALYEDKSEGHFGLKEKTYTHFTSPIRRAADFVVHQIMRKEIAGSTLELTNEEIENIAKRSNWNSYVAKQCKQKEDKLLYGQYVEELCRKKEVKKDFRAQECQEKGILFINEQNVSIFIPTFKLPQECAHWLKKDLQENPDRIDENGWSVVHRAQRFNEVFAIRLVLYKFDALLDKKDYEIFWKPISPSSPKEKNSEVFGKIVEKKAQQQESEMQVAQPKVCALFQAKRT